MRQTVVGIMVGVAVLAAACSGNSSNPTAPSAPVGLTGTWVGSDANGQLAFTIAQSGTALAGTWLAGSGTTGGSGTFSGTIAQEQSVTATLTPSVPTRCPAAVSATVSGNTMRGQWAFFNCTVAGSSTFTVTRQ